MHQSLTIMVSDERLPKSIDIVVIGGCVAGVPARHRDRRDV
jgi:hypothetical protein